MVKTLLSAASPSNNQIYSDADIQILDATDADVALDTYFSATMSKPVILFLTGTAHNFTTTGVKINQQ